MYDLQQERYIERSGWTPERAVDSQLRLFWSRLNEERDFEITRSLTSIPLASIYRAADVIYSDSQDRYRRGVYFNAVEEAVKEYERHQPREKIAKFLYKRLQKSLNYKMPDTIKSLVGQILEVPQPRKLTIRFSLGCAGDAEEYYHENSCYWGSYAASRDYIEASGGGAIRLYQQGSIVGRCWFVPYDGFTLKNGLVLFNFYGDVGYSAYYQWGDLIAEALHVDQHNTHICFDYYGGGDFYLNSGSTVFIGQVAVRTPYAQEFSITFTTPDAFTYSDESSYCDYCEEYVSDTTYVEGYGQVCESCLEENFYYLETGDFEGYYHESEVVVVGYEYYHIEDSDVTQFNGRWYLAEDILIDEKGGRHHVDDATYGELPDGSIWPIDCLVYNEEIEEYELA